MAEEKKEGTPEAKPKNMGMILQIVFAVLNLTIVGGGAFLVYSSTLGWKSPQISETQAMEEKEKNEDATSQQPLIYTMDKFTVNLGGEPRRMIRLEVNLEMLDKDGFEEVIDTQNRAKTRDRIVRLLNDRSFSDIETIQGKLFLKDKIASEINSILDKGVVKDIYFTDFVVQ